MYEVLICTRGFIGTQANTGNLDMTIGPVLDTIRIFSTYTYVCAVFLLNKTYMEA